MSKLIRQPVLHFDARLPGEMLDKIRENISAICIVGKHLWLGADEGTMIERTTRDANGDFGDHQRFDLADLLPGIADHKSEIDIEGLDWDSGYLWVVGSHSQKRKKPDRKKSDQENRERLMELENEANRHVLARVPVNDQGEPVKRNGDLRAARLKFRRKHDQLTQAIQTDPAMAWACEVPGKDNGLDIEGLAVLGNRVFLGLRGPVLRGWAILLEVNMREEGDDLIELDGPLKKHFLRLGGLGIRELVILGKDLLILAGPTMDLDGPVRLYRWRKALENRKEELLWDSEIQKVMEIPFGDGSDHAEGITLDRKSGRLLVSYDSPSAVRLGKKGQVKLDEFEME